MSRPSSFPVATVLPLAIGCAAPLPQTTSEHPPPRTTLPPPADDLVPLETSALCVTTGHVQAIDDRAMRVTDPEMRGVVASTSGHAVEVAFRFHGPSSSDVPLASGELRRQIGLKLRAQDTCNVVYVMWHVAPTPGVFVSVKSNPGQSTHAECGANGYINLRNTLSVKAPPIFYGEAHALHAEIDGSAIRVRADGALVFEAALPPEAFAFDGPVGTRSDNGAFDFEVRVPPEEQTALRCATAPPDSD